MEYTTETLDRRTGDLVLHSLGNFITVTELGRQYDKGPREIRTILHHMGLLQCEGAHGRYRLTPFAVAAGYGKRLKPKRSKYPFDSLSPLCQELIAEAWDDTIADLDNERRQCPASTSAKAALLRFCAHRGRSMETQEAVSWLQQFAKGLTNRQMSVVLSVSEQLVGRYANQAAERRSFLRRATARELPESPSAIERAERWCSSANAKRLCGMP